MRWWGWGWLLPIAGSAALAVTIVHFGTKMEEHYDPQLNQDTTFRNFYIKARCNGLTYCQRCGRCSIWGGEHVTWYEVSESGLSGSGVSALCESCWKELRTAEHRLPFYEMACNNYNWDPDHCRQALAAARDER